MFTMNKDDDDEFLWRLSVDCCPGGDLSAFFLFSSDFSVFLLLFISCHIQGSSPIKVHVCMRFRSSLLFLRG